jgi:hypothetical protein
MNNAYFDFGEGPVPSHRHVNPNGSLGGWVADTATVSATVFIGENAQVSEEAVRKTLTT